MTEQKSDVCIACGWTSADQKRCCYSSHVKLFYGAGNRGVWSIGSDMILKERPDEGPKAEVDTLRKLAAHKDIPVPKLVRDWVDRDGRYFVLMERMDGETLEKAWPSLSESQKLSIADQVVHVRNQLKKITSTSIQAVDQGPCYLSLLYLDFELRGPFHSDAELWDSLILSLRNKSFPEKVLENLKKRLPPCGPYVLTHCDLNLGNIMVKDGELVGILDWEYAAYYPIWYEYVAASVGFAEMDVEWKKLLRQRLDVYEDARNLWRDLYHLRDYPNLDKKGQEILANLSSD
ncbi:kinase-like protein [Aspergillus sclerotioniger CBS 115572]|uniref:Kinase-like protein n=1 Tax=Aspergillus sclerotioniger CBS 115572 TaxID=1450535 RepID=A0A317WZT0_9EURO|nr:kinase-like protein [Aspergillus sclerotioniger CBS 115572]PWY91894.1 kinase-like protein [Aspergillus sclerotioniger CBS 115572]